MHFRTTARSIVESAKRMFVSEDFNKAIALLKDAFENTEEAKIMSLLMGTSYLDENDELINEPDEEYRALLNEVLDLNYNFIIQHNGQYLQLVNTLSFDAKHYKKVAETKASPDAELFVEILAPVTESSVLMQDADLDAKYNASGESVIVLMLKDNGYNGWYVVGNEKVYIFEVFRGTFYKEMCREYTSLVELTTKYDELN
jgi:hypothetical protein